MKSSFYLPPIDSWPDWSAAFNDACLWRPVIDAICECEGIRYRSIETPRSNTNAVFILDRHLVVKIYSPFWSEFDIEPKLIEVLGLHGKVPVPKIVATGQYQDRATWTYVVMEYCPGLTLKATRSTITRGDLLSIASQVGLVASSLHHTDVSLLNGIDDVGESWDDLNERRRREALTQLSDRRMVSPKVVDALAEILDETIAGSRRIPRIVVHGDLESDHILLNKEGSEWRVTSLIDFGDAKIGVRDYEWMPLWLGLFDRDVEAMQAFLGSYDRSLLTDDELPQRVMAWTLLHDFGTEAVADLLEKTPTPTPIETVDEFQKVLSIP